MMMIKRVFYVIFLMSICLYADAPKVFGNGEFYTETFLSSHILYSGESRVYDVQVTNMLNKTIVLDVDTEGVFATSSQKILFVANNSKDSFSVTMKVPLNATNGMYSGYIILKSANTIKKIPYVIEVRYPETNFQFFIKLVSKKIDPKDSVRLEVTITNYGTSTRDNVLFTYIVKDVTSKKTVHEETEQRNISGNALFIKSISLNESITNETNKKPYYVELVADYGTGNVIRQTDSFIFQKPLWTAVRIRMATFSILFVMFLMAAYYSKKWYEHKKKEDARYVFPLTYNTLPKKSDSTFWMGNVAETRIKAYLDPLDLMTHTIVAGSTGAGKSVTASLITEEALKKGIPVVVFDPTAQWTGFVKRCNDKNILSKYKKFGLNSEDDPKPFKGLIKNVLSADEKYDFKKLMNKGEITVFSLNSLSTDAFDEAVANIINEIFGVHWEESTELKLLIVFDEVHRLLEKYGGGSKGGYHALERGAREFRKWGIGLMLCSQVTSDFKTAVAGNIMTEIQMQTKSTEDIKRAKDKYGSDYAKRISSEEIGTGMIQNPKYNKGKPWFVNFRPTLHNPHKISDGELTLYDKYYKEIEALEHEIEKLKAGKSMDAYDLELEVKLAKNSLKEGRFKMCELYIEGLKKRFSGKYI
ncbi:MAG: DUF87 domain-containing protein [Candidatus Aenigmarchaeota archaeon]|nr:DUF87 domain-containing protein [Candidatus Aenigmarchaeota archaeon]